MSRNSPPRQQLNFRSPVRVATPSSSGSSNRVVPPTTTANNTTNRDQNEEASANSSPRDENGEHQGQSREKDLHLQNQLLTKIQVQLESQANQQLAILSSFRETIISLALQVATQLVGSAIEADSGHLFSKLESLFDRIDASQNVSIRLNPVDANRIQDQLNEFTTSSHQIKLVPDGKVELGNCLVESNDQIFVSDWKHQLLEIEKALHQASIFEQNAPHGQTGTQQTENRTST